MESSRHSIETIYEYVFFTAACVHTAEERVFLYDSTKDIGNYSLLPNDNSLRLQTPLTYFKNSSLNINPITC